MYINASSVEIIGVGITPENPIIVKNEWKGLFEFGNYIQTIHRETHYFEYGGGLFNIKNIHIKCEDNGNIGTLAENGGAILRKYSRSFGKLVSYNLHWNYTDEPLLILKLTMNRHQSERMTKLCLMPTSCRSYL